MQRVKRTTAVAVLPAAPAGGTPGYFSAPNPQGGVPATVPGYEWFNNVQEELCNLITAAGLTLDVANQAQLVQAIIKIGLQGSYFNIAAAAGTADAITATYPVAIAALTNGMTLFVRATSANATTAPTFTPNSGTIGAKPIVKGNGLALVAGDIAGGGHWIELQYDQTLDKWVLANPAKGVNAQATSLVIRNADYTTSASSPSKITWTTVKRDPLGLFDAANNQFVVTKAGVYDVRGVIHITPSSAGAYYLHALVNGVITGNSKAGSGGTYNGLSVLQISARMYLNAGDTVALYLYQAGAVPITTFSDEDHTWFEITYTGEQ